MSSSKSAATRGGGGGGFPNTYSLAFDGVDDFVKANLVDGGSIIGGSKTISWWMKLDQYNTTEMIMSIRGTSGSDYFSAWKTNTGQVRFGCRGAVTHGRAADTTKYDVTTLTDWTHFLVTKKLGLYSRGEIVKIFINGVDVTGGNTTVNGGVANEIKIGQIGNIGYMGSLLHGSVDELAVFDGELDSPAEVASIYNGGTPNDLTSLNPLVWYRNGDNGSYKSPQWLIPENSNKDKVSNYSFDFDGVDDRIDVGAVSFLPSATNLTVSTWLKTSDITDNQVVFGDNSATPIFSFEYWGSANRMYFEYGSGLYCYLTLNLVVSNDVWHNLALVYDGSGATNTDKIKIYINGVDKSSSLTFVGTVPTALSASIGNLWLGNGQNYNSPFLGNIDEFAIWNSSLTQENITTIYNSGIPADLTSLSPVSWWRMGEDATFSTNWSLPDNGSGSNTGTSANMTIADLEGNAPNYTGGGLSANMTIEDRVGDAPNSTSNALSYNMTESDRETDVPT
jgi:hypothetical protein